MTKHNEKAAQKVAYRLEARKRAFYAVLYVALLGTLAVLGTAYFFLTCQPAAQGAPAPLPRRAAKSDVPLRGAWVVRWGGARYRYEFRPGGELHGVPWHGSYRFDGRTLWVTESTNPDLPGSWFVWKVTLDDKLEGVAEVLREPWSDDVSGRRVNVRVSRGDDD